LVAGLGANQPEAAGPGETAIADQAPLFHAQFVSLRLKGLNFEQLKLIDAALDRISAGDYGVCAECGGMISSRRLAAVPWAAYCIKCQERVGVGPAPGVRTRKPLSADRSPGPRDPSRGEVVQ
jgi:DnaK suppressor protein